MAYCCMLVTKNSMTSPSSCRSLCAAVMPFMYGILTSMKTTSYDAVYFSRNVTALSNTDTEKDSCCSSAYLFRYFLSVSECSASSSTIATFIIITLPGTARYVPSSIHAIRDPYRNIITHLRGLSIAFVILPRRLSLLRRGLRVRPTHFRFRPAAPQSARRKSQVARFALKRHFSLTYNLCGSGKSPRIKI